MLFIGTLPVLVTTNEYVITCPAVNEAESDGDADFTAVSAGAGAVVGVCVVEGVEMVGVVMPGGVPLAVAELSTAPAVTSAAVTV
jgi:hypothetical protein